jgi:hypothetical protein
MGEMGHGYGSEWHLLRFLGRHRNRFDAEVQARVGAESVKWCDFRFDPKKPYLDGELTALNFLNPDHPARRAWETLWPQRGTPITWDAVGLVRRNGAEEWLLAEAKANIEELHSSCGAKKDGGRDKIEAALEATKNTLCVPQKCNWLDGYYQYCNRITALEFLDAHAVPARLLFIYFVGDKGNIGDESRWRRTCPATVDDWEKPLNALSKHVGLPVGHRLSSRVHELFLEVCPQN